MAGNKANKRNVQRRRVRAKAAMVPRVTMINRLTTVRDNMVETFMATGITRIMGEKGMHEMLDGVMAIMATHIKSEYPTDLPKGYAEFEKVIQDLFLEEM